MRKALIVLLVLNGSLLLLPLLVLVLTVTPAMTLRVSEIRVTNRLPEPIAVTPVALTPSRNGRMPVVVFRSAFPVIRSEQRGDFVVYPGETRIILYDRFDVWLSELVVSFGDGTQRQYVVDPDPDARPPRLPLKVEEITIDDVNQLVHVPPDVATAAAAARATPSWPPAWYWGLIPTGTFVVLAWVYWRTRPGRSRRVARSTRAGFVQGS